MCNPETEDKKNALCQPTENQNTLPRWNERRPPRAAVLMQVLQALMRKRSKEISPNLLKDKKKQTHASPIPRLLAKALPDCSRSRFRDKTKSRVGCRNFMTVLGRMKRGIGIKRFLLFLSLPSRHFINHHPRPLLQGWVPLSSPSWTGCWSCRLPTSVSSRPLPSCCLPAACPTLPA